MAEITPELVAAGARLLNVLPIVDAAREIEQQLVDLSRGKDVPGEYVLPDGVHLADLIVPMTNRRTEFVWTVGGVYLNGYRACIRSRRRRYCRIYLLWRGDLVSQKT